ncbi:MAG: hypothetical protein DMF76_16545 [Acidobacteria bacterium]|nr:MAG: hypothetical protein DMF76_16545 [Acidobacteriota bacterium]
MKLTAQVIALRQETHGLTTVERARHCCDLAKQMEKAGEYEQACEALREFWPERDGAPNLNDLDEPTRADVLLRVGALSGWLGSTDQAAGSQETAKNLITRSIDLFQHLGLSERVAEARGDLALCYWREGSYDEARATLTEALDSLGEKESELRALLLIRAGIIEERTQQLHEAMRLYNQAAPLLDQSEDHALKGQFHNEYGLVFRRLAAPENREDYLDRALMEYTAASFHFELAGNTRYLARVENNLGFLFFTIKKYDEAHKHLDRARRFFFALSDMSMIAQVDDTRARTLLAEGHVAEAQRVARNAVRTLEKGDEQAVLAEALTTHGVALARLGDYPAARRLLQRAIEVAETTGDLEGAGRAKLSIIEELSGQTPAAQLLSIYQSAIELLKQSQDPTTGKRLISCAQKVIEAWKGGGIEDHVGGQEAKGLSWASFRREVTKAEKALIARALREAEGSVTKASYLLGFKHHQSLISIINIRHPDLKKSRSRIRKRRRHLFSEPRRTKRTADKKSLAEILVVHVEENEAVMRLIQATLRNKDMHVDSCVGAARALKILKTGARYDTLIVDNDLPASTGLELVLRIREIPHRRDLPIIMLSGIDCEKEAWRAGVNDFLRKPEDINKIASTVNRLLEDRKERKR